MSDERLDPIKNYDKKDKEGNDTVAVRINIEEDVSEHVQTVQPMADKCKDTNVGNSKRNKKEKDTTQDNLDETQQESGSEKDVSKIEDERRIRRTVMYVYLCPRFNLNFFSRRQRRRVQPPPSQSKRFGFAEGSYTVFAVHTAESRGMPISYEDELGEEEEFDRNIFVRKVFLICSVMLVVTVVLTVLAVTMAPIRTFMRSKVATFLLALNIFGTLCVQYTYCCSNCSRIFPINYSLNFFVTICFSYIASFMSARYAPLVVISAASITLLTSLICLGLAFTSFDFTRFMLPFTIGLLSFLSATLICSALIFFFHKELTVQRMVLLVFSSVSSSTMLVVESQMVLGGKTVQLGEEDFTFGAYMAYNSIVNIFLKVLGVVNFATGISSDD